jgi:predicted deacetylase
VPLQIGNGPEYLIRVDDICPTMSWSTWNEIERILIANDVRPIVAVVPDNRDPELERERPNPNFWDRVRGWKERGWTIALHGYQHLYVTRSPGLIGLNQYSEFAGLDYSEQYRKLAAGLQILDAEHVHPELWVAPAHTFDSQTLRALRALAMTDISDGFGLYPHTDADGTYWIPQQLGRFRFFPVGLWTVCLHIDDPLHADVRSFARHIENYRPFITDVPQAKKRYSTNHNYALSKAWAGAFRWSKRLRHNGLRGAAAS